MPKTLVTGAAGFIGFHLASGCWTAATRSSGSTTSTITTTSAAQGGPARRSWRDSAGFRFQKLDLADRPAMAEPVRARSAFERVVSTWPPRRASAIRSRTRTPTSTSNLVGFLNVLEGCRHNGVEHLVYASSSSVYGANTAHAFLRAPERRPPVSLYAATKKANELMAHTYSHLYGLPTTGLRFFTVYGPWGRPDMALFLFTKAILEGRPIDVFNHGRMRRDFTYIDDIVEGVVRVIRPIPAAESGLDAATRPDPATSRAPYAIYNIGNNQPVELMHFIETLEKCLGRTAEKRMLPMQPGDVPATYADVDDLQRDVGFRPSTPIEEGVARFVDWYREYYGV